MAEQNIAVLKARAEFYQKVAELRKNMLLDTLHALEKYFNTVPDEELVKDKQQIFTLIQSLKFGVMTIQDEFPDTLG